MEKQEAEMRSRRGEKAQPTKSRGRTAARAEAWLVSDFGQVRHLCLGFLSKTGINHLGGD